MLAVLAHEDGSEAGDNAADDVPDAGALPLDAPEPSAAAPAVPARRGASANMQQPGLAAAWVKWKHLHGCTATLSGSEGGCLPGQRSGLSASHAAPPGGVYW